MRGGASGDDTRLRMGTGRPTSVIRVAALPLQDLRAVEGTTPALTAPVLVSTGPEKRRPA
jgi:hypothetical protein